MKKLFLVLAISMVVGLAYAQNTAAESEEEKELTKAEQFLKGASLYREDTYVKFKEDGITAYVKVATDLLTNQKIGYCYFETEVDRSLKFLSLGAAGDPEPLGYLDMDEIDDMILALNKIIEDTKVKKDVKYYQINYSTKSGINVHYNTEDKKVYYYKKWSYTNQYGVSGTFKMVSPPATLKSLAKTVKMLEKAQTIINQNIQ